MKPEFARFDQAIKASIEELNQVYKQAEKQMGKEMLWRNSFRRLLCH